MLSIRDLFAPETMTPQHSGADASSAMLWIQLLADGIIAVSCFAITAGFIYFILRRKDLQHRWIFLVFSAFVLSFGMAHLLSLLLPWHPLHWLGPDINLLTAAISLGTALMVFRIIPNALRIPNPTQLAADVENEIKERREAFVALKTTEISLRESREQLRKNNLELEARVESRTKELERQSSLLRRIIDSIPDIIVLKDINSAYLGSNKAFEEFSGVLENEQIGKTDFDLFDPTLAVNIRQLDRQILESGQAQSQEEWVTYPDGRKTLLSTLKTPFHGPDGEVLGLVGISRDITDRAQAENALRQAAAVFENTREGVMVTDPDKIILMVNRAFSTLMGYSKAEVLGKSTDMLQSDRHDQQFFRRMWTEIKTTGHWQGEVWNRRKNGNEFPELLSISAVTDGTEKITQYVNVFTDISKIKETEAELEFLAHHDPLTRLPNRRLLLSRMRHAMETIHREGGILALLMLDLDRFKGVNDSFGHTA